MGPLLLGLVAVGVPLGAWLWSLGLRGVGDFFFELLIATAIFFAALSAILRVDGGRSQLFWRAFLTSFSAYIPLPLLIWTGMLGHACYEILDIRNFPFAVVAFMLCALLATVVGWLLALAVTTFRKKVASEVAKR
jgi:hypothetical protein